MLVTTLLVNGLLVVGVVFGFYYGITWVTYATAAFVWLMLIVYAVQLFERPTIYRRPQNRVGFWVGRVFDVALTVALINAAAYVTAIAYAASCFILYFILQRPRPNFETDGAPEE